MDDTAISLSRALSRSLSLSDVACCICYGTLQDPVLIPQTGQTYCRECITAWFNTGHASCPATGQQLRSNEVVSNYLARKVVASSASRRTAAAGPDRRAARDQGHQLPSPLQLQPVAENPSQQQQQQLLSQEELQALAARLQKGSTAAAAAAAQLQEVALSDPSSCSSITSHPNILPALVQLLGPGLPSEGEPWWSRQGRAPAREAASAALRSICEQGSDTARQQLGDTAGALAALVALLAPTSTPPLQENAAATLAHVAASSTAARERLAGARGAGIPGALTALASLLQPGTAAVVQQQALAALLAVASGDERCKERVAGTPGLLPQLKWLLAAVAVVEEVREQAAAVLGQLPVDVADITADVSSMWDPPSERELSAAGQAVINREVPGGMATYWPAIPCLTCGCPWWLGENWDAKCARCGWDDCRDGGYDVDWEPMPEHRARWEAFRAELRQGRTPEWPRDINSSDAGAGSGSDTEFDTDQEADSDAGYSNLH